MLTAFKEELAAYAEQHEDERGIVDQFLTFVEQTPDCLSPEGRPGHLVASAWIENRAGDRFLLTKHKKTGHWYQVGGHVEGNPDIRAEAFREAREESGLTNLVLKQEGIFDLNIFFVTYGAFPHFHYNVCYLLKSLDVDDAIQISDESDELAWFDSLPEPGDGSEQMFKKWKMTKCAGD